jgi:hypothetical protein
MALAGIGIGFMFAGIVTGSVPVIFFAVVLITLSIF